MKRAIYCAVFILHSIPLFSQVQDENDQNYDFNYSRVDSMKNTRMLRFDFAPAHIGVHGEHLAFSAGGTIVAQHFLNRFSLDATFFYRYYAENWVSSWPGIKTQVKFGITDDPFKYRGKEYDAHLSYSLINKTRNKKYTSLLKRERGRDIVSDFWVNEHRILDLRIGYSYFDLPSYLDISGNNLPSSSIYFKQNVRALSLGFSFKKMHNDKFKTDRYGEISSNSFSELYVDLLFGLNPSFPDRLFQPVYVPISDSYVYTESTAETVENVKNTLKHQRLGAVLGYRWTPYGNGLSIASNLAFRPRYLGTVFQLRGLLTFGFTISYTLMDHQKNMEFLRYVFTD
jgi:hypothetical protein